MSENGANKNSELAMKALEIGLSSKILPISGRLCNVYGDTGDPFFDAMSPAHFHGLAPGGYGSFDNFCSKYLKPEYVMIDVGANIGITALIAGAYIAQGRIVAIDASPRNCAALEANLKCNGFDDAVVLPFAVGSAHGEFQFQEAGAHGHVLTETIALGRVGITVPVRTIDQIVEELDLPRVDFIKIDIEGFERDAVIGAEQTIRKWNPLFYIEFNSLCQITVHNESPLRFYNFLLDKFKYVYRIDEDNLIALDKEQGVLFVHDNILRRGCVEDVVASNCGERLIEAPRYLEKRIERLELEQETLRIEHDALRQERENLLAQPEFLIAECEKLRAERDRLASKLERMKRSVYWRWVAPVRKLGKKMR